ncbi:HNH endonuclease signature motif containing protein [Streptomyces sp. NPDC002668]|uniref:HNH endonuclease signature motif containing protein n=1 Tax=Streptomyces sp. NPDC002668 TaxID=3154422 RepID=UPI00332A1508
MAGDWNVERKENHRGLSGREQKLAAELERRATELRANSEEGLSIREAVALAAVQLGMSPELEYEARAEVRFWERVKKLRTRCWEWQGTKNADGYGLFSVGGQSVPAHRFAYESRVGPIARGLVIDHTCRNPSCVRPSHLEPVTSRENWLRGFSPSAIEARKRETEEWRAENAG